MMIRSVIFDVICDVIVTLPCCFLCRRQGQNSEDGSDGMDLYQWQVGWIWMLNSLFFGDVTVTLIV